MNETIGTYAKLQAMAEKKSPTLRVTKTTKPEKTNERTKERKVERTKIRHTFDIYEDQLFRLQEMKIGLRRKGKKPKLGDLVQQALDQFLKKNERTN